MYKITQLESGQPVIFYLENEKVTMYSINSSERKNGNLRPIHDVESDFDICSDLAHSLRFNHPGRYFFVDNTLATREGIS